MIKGDKVDQSCLKRQLHGVSCRGDHQTSVFKMCVWYKSLPLLEIYIIYRKENLMQRIKKEFRKKQLYDYASWLKNVCKTFFSSLICTECKSEDIKTISYLIVRSSTKKETR